MNLALRKPLQLASVNILDLEGEAKSLCEAKGTADKCITQG